MTKPRSARRHRHGHPAFYAIALCLAGLLVVAMNLVWAQGAPGSSANDKAWWIAVDQDQVSTVQSLLLRGADTNQVNDQGNPALMQAVRRQSWGVFDTLRVAPGIDLNRTNAHDETALMYLAILGQTARARQLIDAGAQVNRLGWTPLHYAASKGQLETARMLVGQGAIVNAPGTDGTTPLMMAALSGNVDTVRYLLSQGADPRMFNLDHETAGDWARRGRHERLAAQLDALVARPRPGQRTAEGVSEPPTADTATPADREAAEVKKAAPRDGGSSSRYFNLDRFESAVQ